VGQDTILNFHEGQYRGEAPDMGAFEFGFDPVVADKRGIPSSYERLLIYPNPFNSTATVRFYLLVTSEYSLYLFDLNGRVVREIAAGRYVGGMHRLRFNAVNLSSGTYLLYMRTADGIKTAPILLVK
jgi:hypothetical protein